MADIKFCGMTRAADARQAAALGARYVGVVLTESPRMLSDDEAQRVLAELPRDVARVGVFGPGAPEHIASRARKLALDVVQLHGDPDRNAIEGIRRRWDGEVWAVQRIRSPDVPANAAGLFDAADAVVLDTHVAGGQLGGTGVPLPWAELRQRISSLRNDKARLVLAGGLNPANVGRAIDSLHPDVVDVSSGVEASVGVKDHERMRAFRDAVRLVEAR